MTQRAWVILGATSIIAEKFAHLLASKGSPLYLVGRDEQQLAIIAKDIQLRYQVPCVIINADMTESSDKLSILLSDIPEEFDLFIAHSNFTGNEHLNAVSIRSLIEINVLATAVLINSYLNLKQKQSNLLYLSSVAACRGRAKNSLYGGTKAAIEIYLQGLQQAASVNEHITIARLGFIDTKQTYGLPGIFYAAPPEACAMACWKAINKRKRMVYYPGFWRFIMGIIIRLPFFVYKRMGSM